LHVEKASSILVDLSHPLSSSPHSENGELKVETSFQKEKHCIRSAFLFEVG
jgi:hypothetical protein